MTGDNKRFLLGRHKHAVTGESWPGYHQTHVPLPQVCCVPQSDPEIDYFAKIFSVRKFDVCVEHDMTGVERPEFEAPVLGQRSVVLRGHHFQNNVRHKTCLVLHELFGIRFAQSGAVDALGTVDGLRPGQFAQADPHFVHIDVTVEISFADRRKLKNKSTISYHLWSVCSYFDHMNLGIEICLEQLAVEKDLLGYDRLIQTR